MSFRGLRDSLASLVPKWLSNRPGLNTGYKILFAAATQGDILLEYAIEGVQAWFPGLTLGAPGQALDASTALSIMGASRGILQGDGESDASFVIRLRMWLDLWRLAGRPGGILLALLGYVLPSQPLARTVDNSGNWYTYTAGQNPFSTQPPATPTLLQVSPSNWRWDSLGPFFQYPFAWWRVWAILYSVGGSPFPVPSATWGSFHWGDGTVWGFGGTYTQAKNLLSLVQQWSAAHAFVTLIVSYDATMFDPAQAFGSAKLPDGHWGTFGKVVADATYGTIYKAARPSCAVASISGGIA